MAFPPPPVTSPATRLKARKQWAASLPFGCSFPKGVARFYPNNSKSLATFLASLSASVQGVNSNRLPRFCCSQTMRHRFCSPLLVPVIMPVSILTMNGFYTRFFSCQAENTLSFALILRANPERSVEKNPINLWITLWKTLQVFPNWSLKIRLITLNKNTPCAKLQNDAWKKIRIRKKNICSD